jgi:hypothetical protein
MAATRGWHRARGREPLNSLARKAGGRAGYDARPGGAERRRALLATHWYRGDVLAHTDDLSGQVVSLPQCGALFEARHDAHGPSTPHCEAHSADGCDEAERHRSVCPGLDGRNDPCGRDDRESNDGGGRCERTTPRAPQVTLRLPCSTSTKICVHAILLAGISPGVGVETPPPLGSGVSRKTKPVRAYSRRGTAQVNREGVRSRLAD